MIIGEQDGRELLNQRIYVALRTKQDDEHS